MRGIEPYDREAYKILRAQGVWSVTDVSWGTQAVAVVPIWKVGDYPLMSADGESYLLWVGGGTGVFVIVDESDVVVFAGMHSGATHGEVFSVPVSVLEYGVRYRVADGAGQGFNTSVPFRTKVVWRVRSVPQDVTPERLGLRWDFPAVGTDFLSWQLHWSGQGAPPTEPWHLLMCIGPWDYNMTPTVPFSGMEVLGTLYGDLGFGTSLWDSNRLVFSWTIALNDPVFVGFRAAAQGIGVSSTGELFASDVVGVVLQ